MRIYENRKPLIKLSYIKLMTAAATNIFTHFIANYSTKLSKKIGFGTNSCGTPCLLRCNEFMKSISVL